MDKKAFKTLLSLFTLSSIFRILAWERQTEREREEEINSLYCDLINFINIELKTSSPHVKVKYFYVLTDFYFI